VRKRICSSTVLCCHVQAYVERHLKPVWDWLVTVLDATEAQLQFGSTLSYSDRTNQPSGYATALSAGAAASTVAPPASVQRSLHVDRALREEQQLSQVLEKRRTRFMPGTFGLTSVIIGDVKFRQ
jgi:hypothetical protein